MFSFLKDIFETSNPRKKFADLVRTELQKNGLTVPLEFDEREFKLSTKEEPRHIIFLGNMFAQYLKAGTPEAKAKVLENCGSAFSATFNQEDEDFHTVSPRLMIGCRERSFVEFSKLQMQLEGLDDPGMETRQISENLSLCIAIDYPDRIAYVGGETLKDWGVTFEEAYQVAYRNLQAKTSPFQVAQPGLYWGLWSDNYAPSRLAMVDMIRELVVDGLPVAIAPNRDMLFITGSQDIVGQRLMLGLTRKALEEPNPMSPRPLILKDGVWLNYFPQHDTPLFDEYAMLWVESTSQDYAEQRAHLEKLNEKNGTDVFVASYSSMQHNETKKIESFCVWSKDVVSLLPKTDVVIFHDHTKPEKMQMACKARWKDVQEKAGGLMEAQDIYPVRFKVSAFPDEETLKAMNLPE